MHKVTEIKTLGPARQSLQSGIGRIAGRHIGAHHKTFLGRTGPGNRHTYRIHILVSSYGTGCPRIEPRQIPGGGCGQKVGHLKRS